MEKNISARKILGIVKGNDTWFGLKYNMNLYRGCQHGCIYCDSRSLCYGIDNFDNEILIKENAVDLLDKEIRRLKVRGTIGFGSMNDPYMPIELKYELVKKSLKVIERFRFPVHILTKSNLVLRDIEALNRISNVYSAVSFTVTTPDDNMSKIIEPNAPVSSERFKAMSILSCSGILTGTLLMPVLPYIEDQIEKIHEIIAKTKENGGKYIVSSFGVTLRDRQKEYLINKLRVYFPEIADRYEEHKYYGFSAVNCKKLEKYFYETCTKYGILTKMPIYRPPVVEQLTLF
ncbi:MAG: radical SAM protein [Candidatus Delongbacteria bacterium]|nr:radical SAM protein [Candidatus Delongbacteria bacterium]MBN2836301.1 radical SAM protein [Candidatus Delongbacteria bacterium]